MFEYFDYFLPQSSSFDAYPLHETKNGYEFTAYGFAVNPNEGYVVVVGADRGRVPDMVDIIAKEFDAVLEGWLVLLKHQKPSHKIIRSPQSKLNEVTYYDNFTPVWIIKIKPNKSSHLLRKS